MVCLNFCELEQSGKLDSVAGGYQYFLHALLFITNTFSL